MTDRPPQPFQFYPTARLCPCCGRRLLTATPVNRKHLQGQLQWMGITCYCVTCNIRYRAVSRLPFAWAAWAGPAGRWLWWQTTTLEKTLPP